MAPLLAWAGLIAVLALLGGCSSDSAVDLTGHWESDGYHCESAATLIHETFDIVQTGTKVVATKMTGDNCVKGGHISFQGTVEGNTGKVDYYVATPGGTPSIQWRDQVLTITDPNTFVVTFQGVPVTYARYPPLLSSLGTPWWFWVVLAVLAAGFVAVLIVAVRRSRHGRRGTTPPAGGIAA